MNAVTEQLDRQADRRYREANSNTEHTESGTRIHAEGHSPVAHADAHVDSNSTTALWFGVLGAMFGTAALVLSLVAFGNSNHVADAAASAARAQAKAETATARANVSEIYSKQLYTELNRLGYPVKTPAEDHAPQPSDNVSEVPGK